MVQPVATKRAIVQGHYTVLFLCTGNSARSIMAEAIMNHKGRANFTAYSAGTHPLGKVRPEALRQLEAAQVPINNPRSKNWDEFAKPGAPKLDFVFTVCDHAAKELCPIWPVSRSRLIGEFPIQQRSWGAKNRLRRLFVTPSFCLIAGSASSFVCHLRQSFGLH